MINKIKENVYSIKSSNFGSIVYLIKLNKKNIIIDTDSIENKQELIDSLKELNLTPKDIHVVILTHNHWDHLENTGIFSNAKVYSNFKKKINRDSSQTPIKNIISIEKLNIPKFKIYKTPGHTQSDIIILYKNILFSGDVIFHNGYIGRTDFQESSPEKMKKSLEFIKKLKYNILCPGHG